MSALCALLIGAAASGDPPPVRDQTQAVAAPTPTPTGTGITAAATCSNANCHGAASGDTWRQSYRLWARRDPHADAYHVLFRGPSRRMVAKLNGGRRLAREDYQRFVDAQCAACHATTHGPETAAGSIPRTDRSVTCGACHGDPERWLEGHLAADPPEMSRAVPRPGGWGSTEPDYAFRDLRHEVTRARTCVGCHVGSAGDAATPRREVNHDLIAAGHPRLAFEYTSHLANLPRHWRRSEAAGDASFSWAVGQLVAAEAAADLLATRSADESAAWPEFAEYDCAACHHRLHGVDLRPPGAVRARPSARGPLYAWGGWYFSLAPAAATQPGPIDESLDTLRTALTPLVPDRAAVAAAAGAASERLRDAIDRLRDRRDAAQVSRSLAERTRPPLSWDAAAQAYLWHANRLAASESRPLLEALDPPELAARQNGPRWLHADVNRALEALEKIQKQPR